MKEPNPSKNKLSDKFSGYLKYSGMAFQMAAVILIGVGIGIFLDKKFDSKPIFTAIFSLLFVAASLYLTLKDLLKQNK